MENEFAMMQEAISWEKQTGLSLGALEHLESALSDKPKT